MSFEESAGTGFATMRGRNYPAIRQFTVFLENQGREAAGSDPPVRGEPGADRGPVDLRHGRMCPGPVPAEPSRAGREILERAGLAIVESDLIGVELPEGPQALLDICTALLQAEVNIVQAYPLLARPRGRAAVALMVDNIEIAQDTLAAKGFAMITEADLQEEE